MFPPVNASPHSSDDAHASGDSVIEWEGAIYDGQRTTYGLRPAAYLRATAEALYVRGPRGDYQLARSRIWKIARGDFYPWLFDAIQIHHGIQEYPNEIQFKPATAGVHAVLSALKELGYPVV